MSCGLWMPLPDSIRSLSLTLCREFNHTALDPVLPPCLHQAAPAGRHQLPQQPRQRHAVLGAVLAVLLLLGALVVASGAGRLLWQRRVRRQGGQQPDGRELLPLAQPSHQRPLTISSDGSLRSMGELRLGMQGLGFRGRQQRMSALLSTRQHGIQMLPMDALRDVLAHQLGPRGRLADACGAQQHMSTLATREDAPLLAADGNRLAAGGPLGTMNRDGLASAWKWQLATESLRVGLDELQVWPACGGVGLAVAASSTLPCGAC